MQTLEVDGARMTREFADLHYRIYTFDSPLQPGRAAEVRVRDRARAARVPEHRQRDARRRQRHVPRQLQIAPVLGMATILLLQDRAKRRKYGLPPELRPPKLEDEQRARIHYFRHDSDWVNADITVSTDADQARRSRPATSSTSRVVDGRRDRALPDRGADPGLLLDPVGARTRCARTAGTTSTWPSTTIRRITYNVDRMLRAMKASLDYYATEFQPVPVPAAPHRRVPGVHELRAGVPGHDPVLGSGRLHHRRHGPEQDRRASRT